MTMERTRLRPFSRRLMVRLLLLALLAMLLVAITQACLISRDAKQQHKILLDNLAATQLPLLQFSLWNAEIITLEKQLKRILDLPDVSSVRLQSATGLDMFFGTVAAADHAAYTSLIIRSPADDNQQLAELQVVFSEEQLTARIYESIVQRFLELSLYTLLLFAMLFHMLHRDISKPLRLIADYVNTLKLQKDAPRLELRHRSLHWHDEIDLIAGGVDALHAAMAHGAEQYEDAIKQLAHERDSLDCRVAERTSELAYLNGYLQLISGTSMKLMHLQQAQYPQFMSQTLQALGQYLQLNACALLDNQQLRAYWMADADPQWLHQFELLSITAGEPGWSVTRLDAMSLAILFSSPQRSFIFAVRGPGTSDQETQRQGLLQGSGQWLFSLLQHWDRAISLEKAQQELLGMSRTDPLTGLANRRHFGEHQADELRRAQRLGYPVSLLMLDVDFFKAFNDRYGHAEGDACLIQLVRVLNDRFKRAGELAARWGGEEFTVLLPGMNLDAAQHAAEALAMAIYDLHIPHAGSVWGRVTVSIGCAQWTVEQGGDTEQIIQSLMSTADAALYEAKGLGRNQVVAAPAELFSGGL